MATTTLKLPRLPVKWESNPELIRRYWDQAMTELEKTLNAILAIPEIQEALQDLDTATQAALDAADAATQAATQAQETTDAQKKEASIVNSYVSNYSAPLISSDDAGNVTIATHDRVYGDSSLNPTVTVNGATINTGAVPGDLVRVYYNDPSRAGGGVTYQFTIDPSSPPVQGGNVHSVGAVEVPNTGINDGRGVTPPGYVPLD